MKRLSPGQVLKRIRVKRGLSQAEIARATGIDPAYLSQIESGKRGNARFETIATICYAIGSSLDEIAGPCGLKPPKKTQVNVGLLRRLLEKLRAIIDDIIEELP